MEEDILEIVLALAQSRNEFFSSTNIRLLNYPARTGVLTRFMHNEQLMIELMNRMYSNHLYTTTANALFTLSLPARFTDPVVVTPTQTQINQALENIIYASSPCAICQDPISSDGVRIITCQHEYHRSCVSNWFSMSVRCPICRHDIREGGQPAQTSAASTGTPARSASQ